MAPHTPPRSGRPGEPVTPLDRQASGEVSRPSIPSGRRKQALAVFPGDLLGDVTRQL